MQALKVSQTVEREGELHLTGLPIHKGEEIELIVLRGGAAQAPRPLTVGDLLDSDVVGMWADRTDIGDSAAFARKLRAEALRGKRE